MVFQDSNILSACLATFGISKSPFGNEAEFAEIKEGQTKLFSSIHHLFYKLELTADTQLSDSGLLLPEACSIKWMIRPETRRLTKGSAG